MILVTGGSGLVGSHLLMELVITGVEKVRSICRDSGGVSVVKELFIERGFGDYFERIDWFFVDILDVNGLEAVFEGVEKVYHCAGFISFDPKDEQKLRKINIEGTANIVNLCIEYGVSKLCHVSSIAALGDLRVGEFELDERSEWNAERLHSDYAITKYGGELEVWRGKEEGLRVMIVNPGVILGEGNWEKGSGLLFSRVWRGMRFYTSGTTGYVGVEDVVKMMVKLMESGIEGERIILVSENISYKEIIEKIAVRMGKEAPRWRAGKVLLGIVWRVDKFLSLFGKRRFITKEGVESVLNADKISNKKSIEMAGMNYEKVEDILDRLVQIFMRKKV